MPTGQLWHLVMYHVVEDAEGAAHLASKDLVTDAIDQRVVVVALHQMAVALSAKRF
jgi:hypothetical protein